MGQATTLKPGQIRHLLRVTNGTSRYPERDCLILLLGITCGMRITEISLLEIGDIMFASGALRTEVSLRAATTKGCRQRCVYLTHRQTITALERYLAYRTERGLGTELTTDKYRGLSPQTKLILKQSGGSFCQNTKRRVNFGGERIDYTAADSLQGYVTRLFLKAGTRGRSHSGRRTMASNLLAQGTDIESVQQLLGHQTIECLRPYLEVDPKKLREMFSVVL